MTDPVTLALSAGAALGFTIGGASVYLGDRVMVRQIRADAMALRDLCSIALSGQNRKLRRAKALLMARAERIAELEAQQAQRVEQARAAAKIGARKRRAAQLAADPILQSRRNAA